MTVQELTNALELTVFTLGDPQQGVTGGYAGDLLSWVMGKGEPGHAWLTIMSNHNVAAVALLTEVACIILTEGVEPDEMLRRRAEQEGLNLLGTPLSTFDMCTKLQPILAE